MNRYFVKKALVRRVAAEDDRRCTRVVLTPQGEQVFEREFPRQIAYLKKRFDRLTRAELKEAEQVLRRLRGIF